MILPPYVKAAISKLHDSGFDVFAVGGCVRDYLMGIDPFDYDLCTSALPDDVCRVFDDCNIIKAGIKHGTVAVISDGRRIEITTFRTENIYSDKRHPDSVTFTKSIIDDLKRRDFTINAIAFSEKEGYIDPFGGRFDIEGKTIRCVGNPITRFSEDALRIIRALRFSSVLGFKIEPNTAEAVNLSSENIKYISPERISSELLKLICGDFFEQTIKAYPKVFAEIIPELLPCIDYSQQNPHHAFDLLTHLAKTVTACPKNAELRLAALLHDIGKPHCKTISSDEIAHYYRHAAVSADMADTVMKRLKMSNDIIKKVCTLIKYHDGVIEESEKAVKRLILKLGEEYFNDLLSLQRADNIAQHGCTDFRAEHNSTLRKIASDLKNKESCFDLKSLAVNGNDIISLGFSGKTVGNALKFLLYAMIDENVPNEKNQLIAYLTNNFK